MGRIRKIKEVHYHYESSSSDSSSSESSSSSSGDDFSSSSSSSNDSSSSSEGYSSSYSSPSEGHSSSSIGSEYASPSGDESSSDDEHPENGPDTEFFSLVADSSNHQRQNSIYRHGGDYTHTIEYPEPTHRELLEMYESHNIWPGKHCPHPVNAWFKDTRAIRPPLKSRTKIFRDIVSGTDLPESVKARYTASYLPRDDPWRLREEASKDTFEYFSHLPPEIRCMVWQMAAEEPRFVDWRRVNPHAFSRWGRTSLPTAAMVCREAYTSITRLAQLYKSNSPVVNRALGYVGPNDILYCVPAQTQLENGDIFINDVDTAPSDTFVRSVIDALGTKTIVVPWSHEFIDRVSWERHWEDMSDEEWFFMRDWSYLKDLSSVETVYVSWISSIDTPMAFADSKILTVRVKNGSDWDLGFPITAMVDLYDDQRLAEIASLETERSENVTPHYRDLGVRPRMCVDCERVDWENRYRSQVVKLWLLLHRNELNEPDEAVNEEDYGISSTFGSERAESGTKSILLADGSINVQNPWVQDKLSRMPNFKPCVLVKLYLRLEGQKDIYDHWENEQARRPDYSWYISDQVGH